MAIFTEVFEDVTKQGRKIPTSDYLESGLHPIIDQGQSEIAGYSNETDGLFTDVPAIIFGDHTRVIKYVDTPCFLGADGVKLLKAKIADPNYKYLYYALSNADIPNTGYNRHFKWLKEVDIPLPSEMEQQHIVEVFDQLCTLIALRKEQLAKLDQLVKSRFVEMFGDPVINEKGYEKKKLGNISKKISDGVHAKPVYTEFGRPFLSVVNINKGFVNFNGCKFVSEDAYQKMIKSTHPERGDVLYTKVGATYGIPAYVDTDVEFAKDVYADAGKPIAKPTGELVGLVPRAIKAALAPVEKWVLQQEYNVAETKRLLEKKLENVQPELIEAPEAHIAVPALQYISYCMDNEELRDMYANLLASSMNSIVKTGVHPSFVEIIKQLSPDEAKILRYIYNNRHVPVIGLDVRKTTGGSIEVLRVFSDITWICGCEDIQGYEKYFDNLSRLALINIPDNERLAEKTAYESLKQHPYISGIKAHLAKRPDISSIDYTEKHLELSAFGKQFCSICIRKNEDF